MLQDAGSIADLIGAVGVMVSLVFVGVQMAQANKLARSAAQQRQIDAVARLSRQPLEAPGFADLYARANLGMALTLEERIKIESVLVNVDRVWEGLHLLYVDGQIDKDLWEAHRTQALSALLRYPVARAVWNARKAWFTPEYRAFRDAELAATGGDVANYDYFEALETPKPVLTQPPKS